MHEIDISNNRLSRLPRIGPKVIKFKVNGNFTTVPGPYLGTDFLIKDLKFNEPDLVNSKIIYIPTEESKLQNVTIRKQKIAIEPIYLEPRINSNEKSIELETRPLSAQSSKSSISSSSSKSSLSSVQQNDDKIAMVRFLSDSKRSLRVIFRK